MIMSRHAKVRANQRGFQNEIIDFIINNGSYSRSPGNTQKIKFKKKDYEKMINELKYKIKLAEKAKNKVILLSEDTIITMYRER